MERRWRGGVGAPSILAIAAAGIAACSLAEPREERAGEAAQPIVGGEKCKDKDKGNEHMAIVAIEIKRKVMDKEIFIPASASIIAAHEKIACVLTAAHVCKDADPDLELKGGDKVLVGHDKANPDTTYTVVKDSPKAHPSFKVNMPDAGWDFCLFTIDTTDKAPPTPLTLASEANDGLAIGSDVLFSGYGFTDPAGNANTFRHHITKAVTGLTVTPQGPLIYDFQGAPKGDGTGFCQGDSGGPAIFGGKVVGVISLFAFDPLCVGPKAVGYSGRVAYVNNSKGDNFIGDYLKEKKCVPTTGTTSSSSVGSTGATGAGGSWGIGSSSSGGQGGFNGSGGMSGSSGGPSGSGGFGGAGGSSGGQGGSGGFGGAGGASSSSGGDLDAGADADADAADASADADAAGVDAAVVCDKTLGTHGDVDCITKSP